MVKKYLLLFVAVSFLLMGFSIIAKAQTDTVRIMAYNVLNYGYSCQGADTIYHNYLRAVVQYTNPDVISLEKMGSIPMYQGDIHGKALMGFGDSILKYALNAAFASRYAYCPFTNYSGADNMSMLFYDKSKFGFVTIAISYANLTDFNCYKLYYKDPNLATTHDTTFLYIIPNHDQSGDASVATRAAQITGYMQHIMNHFSHLPNIISMGDFNLRYTAEPLYQTLTAPADTNFRFYDPPFYPDAHVAYPADWDSNPTPYTSYLTTSTRASSTAPNNCGTSGGAKSWYDHIFVSPWIVNNANYIQYVPNSYRTIGNDGHRLSRSVNDNSSVTNTSAPPQVINAIYQMSNKYPIMVDLAITQNTTGSSPVDPELFNTAVRNINNDWENISVVNRVNNVLTIRFPSTFVGEPVSVICYDTYGRIAFNSNAVVNSNIIQLPCSLKTGAYFMRILGNEINFHATILKQ